MRDGPVPGVRHTMAVVRRLTGLTDRQIRYYDQRGLVVPTRSAGGHRLYSDAQIRRLLAVKTLLARGRTVADARAELGPSPD